MINYLFLLTRTLVDLFGQITGTTYSSLSNNSVLTSNTTLYCVTENKDTPQVNWSYVDLAGTTSNLTSLTDATTGVSNIQVFTTEPGFYTCEVLENGGSSNTYTAVMADNIINTGKNYLIISILSAVNRC